MPDEPKTNYTRYPVEGMDQWLSSGGCNALDPYTFYTNLRPLEKIFGFLTDPTYSVWDLYAGVTKAPISDTPSIREVLQPREGDNVAVETDPYKPYVDQRFPQLHYDKTYYPNRSFLQDFFQLDHVTPVLWNPLTDLAAPWQVNPQTKCQPLEKTALECIEYYGLRQGRIVCSDFYDDYIECSKMNVRSLRRMAFQMEQKKRWVEYKKGLRKDWSSVYKPNPPVHAFVEPFAKINQPHGPEPSNN